jgi:hypothetical protein
MPVFSAPYDNRLAMEQKRKCEKARKMWLEALRNNKTNLNSLLVASKKTNGAYLRHIELRQVIKAMLGLKAYTIPIRIEKKIIKTFNNLGDGIHSGRKKTVKKLKIRDLVSEKANNKLIYIFCMEMVLAKGRKVKMENFVFDGAPDKTIFSNI